MAEQSYGDWIRSNPQLPIKKYKKEHMAQQTAVEYLFKIYELTGDISNAQWDKARRMQKEEAIDSYKHGQNNGYNYRSNGTNYITGEEYYNETYKQNT